jgi:hypothetical protein
MHKEKKTRVSEGSMIPKTLLYKYMYLFILLLYKF